jgi:hypothetical protein
MTTYKIIKSLKPNELFEIITIGYCPDYLEKFKNVIISEKGRWYLDNPFIDWYDSKVKLDLLDFYLSDSGFTLYTSKEEAKRLEVIFKELKIYTDVWSSWYGGKTWTFGFSYSYDTFNKLHQCWVRNKKIDKIIN